MDEFKDKLRSIGFSRLRGTAERKPVLREEDGSIGGYQTTHWDDHQDAEVIVKPVEVDLHIMGEQADVSIGGEQVGEMSLPEKEEQL